MERSPWAFTENLPSPPTALGGSSLAPQKLSNSLITRTQVIALPSPLLHSFNMNTSWIVADT